MKRILTATMAMALTAWLSIYPQAASNDAAHINTPQVGQAATGNNTTSANKQAKPTTVKVVDIANNQDVANINVPEGAYTPAELLAKSGLKGYVLAERQTMPFVGGKLEVKAGNINALAVSKVIAINVEAYDVNGNRLGVYSTTVSRNYISVHGFVTALTVANPSMVVEAGSNLPANLLGYYALANDARNQQPQKSEQWANNIDAAPAFTVKAYYVKTTAPQNNGAASTMKQGQVGKTGEVAGVVSGFGLLLTLAAAACSKRK